MIDSGLPVSIDNIFSVKERKVSNMSFIRKLMAAVLILAMTFGLVVVGNAATSPSEVVEPANPGYDPATDTDTETGDGSTVVYKVGDPTVTVLSVERLPAYPSTKSVYLQNARNKDNKKVAVTTIGDGKKGVFDSKYGRKFKRVIVKGVTSVTINKNAFKGSIVTKVELRNQKTKFKKGAFTGTKKTKVEIELKGAKTASDVTVSKGAFDGLDKYSVIYVKKSNMSKAEFNKLVAKLRKAGYTGKFIRK